MTLEAWSLWMKSVNEIFGFYGNWRDSWGMELTAKGSRQLIWHLQKLAQLLKLGARGWRVQMIDLTSAEVSTTHKAWNSLLKGADDWLDICRRWRGSWSLELTGGLKSGHPRRLVRALGFCLLVMKARVLVWPFWLNFAVGGTTSEVSLFVKTRVALCGFWLGQFLAESALLGMTLSFGLILLSSVMLAHVIALMQLGKGCTGWHRSCL